MRHPKFDMYERGGCPCDLFDQKRRRLYIREGPRGKQKFIPWGVICKNCGFVYTNRDNAIQTMKEQIKWAEGADKRKKRDNKEAAEALAKLRGH